MSFIPIDIQSTSRINRADISLWLTSLPTATELAGVAHAHPSDHVVIIISEQESSAHCKAFIPIRSLEGGLRRETRCEMRHKGSNHAEVLAYMRHSSTSPKDWAGGSYLASECSCGT